MNPTSLSAATIIRIKSVHFDEIFNPTTFDRIVKKLDEKGFIIAEKSDDEFVITYSNNLYTNENRNTIIFFDSAGNLSYTIFTVRNAD